MTPSWYDVLGVDPDASAEEIRVAWRTSVDGLDPTDRRFRLCNRAAEVLLDPDKRAAHDGDLAADAADEADGEHELDRPGSTREQRSVSGSSGTALATAPAPAPATATRQVEPAHDDPATRRRRVRTLVGVAVLALVLLLATVLALHNAGDDTVASGATGSAGSASASGGLPDEQDVADAVSAAQSAIVPVLSYDYRSLPQGEKLATSFMTPDFATKYQQIFEAGIAVNAPSTKTVVKVQVLSAGVARTAPGQVDVLLFVNRPTTNKARSVVYHDQVTARMVQSSGTWLVGCLITSPDGTCGTG